MLLWSGDFVSAIGSGLTSFGLGVYIFQQTGKASQMALVTLLAFLPSLLLGPMAGVLADRYDRRLLMILGDSLSAVGLLFILLGNYMPRIKQNYTFGCRTPWALADEHNWNRTQRMGGFTFILIGAATLLAGVFSYMLGPTGSLAVLLGATLLGTAWIYVYSFLVFKGLMK